MIGWLTGWLVALVLFILLIVSNGLWLWYALRVWIEDMNTPVGEDKIKEWDRLMSEEP